MGLRSHLLHALTSITEWAFFIMINRSKRKFNSFHYAEFMSYDVLAELVGENETAGCLLPDGL